MGPLAADGKSVYLSPRTLRVGVIREAHRGKVLVVMVRLLHTLCLRGGAIGRLRTCRRSSGADPNAKAFFRFRN